MWQHRSKVFTLSFFDCLVLFPLSGSPKFKWSFHEISVKINAAFNTFAELQCNLFTNLVFLILSGTAKLSCASCFYIPLAFNIWLLHNSLSIICQELFTFFFCWNGAGRKWFLVDFWLLSLLHAISKSITYDCRGFIHQSK